jgi:hypothetical protein
MHGSRAIAAYNRRGVSANRVVDSSPAVASRFPLSSHNRDIRFAIMRWRTPVRMPRIDLPRVAVLPTRSAKQVKINSRERHMNIRSNRFIQSSVAVAVLGMALAAPGAFGANSQQSKMTDCNKQAADKKGDERKAFMKSCLAAAPAPASAPMTQQDKMTACNKSATGKSGDDRKAYMKSCLSNKG